MQGMHYRAIDQQGHVHTGFAPAAGQSEFELWLSQKGWQPLPVSSCQRLFNFLRIRPPGASWSKTSAALFTLNLSQLLGAGVPLVQALEEIRQIENNRLVHRVLESVALKVNQGGSLCDALSEHPDLFSADYVASVKAGERSGQLSRCLELQAASLRWQADIANRLKTVLTYPAFALFSLVVVLLFVLLYLVPAMQPLLEGSSIALPWRTQILLDLSVMLQESGLTIFLVMCALVGLLGVIYSSHEKIRLTIQSFLFGGRYGQILTCFSLSRYARTTSVLYEAGIEITEAMRISQNMVGNKLLRSQLENASELVLSGQTLGNAMRAQPMLPVLFVRMVLAGERAGVLGVALQQSAEQLQINAQYALDRIERLLGPVLLCFMGAVLLWVATSVLGPIYSSITDSGAFL